MTRLVRWIDTAAALEAFAAGAGPGPFGIDTEADSLHRYRERLCLLQWCEGEDVAVLDPLALPDLSPVRGILEDPGRRKVLHGGDYDVRLVRREHGIALAGLFDTMIAARLCGEREFGLSVLLERHLGVVLDKAHQRADWSRRPLPERMLAYAAEDTRHLVSLARILEAELDRLGRKEWAEEEFRRLEEVRWSEPPDDPERFRRVKGGGSLDGRGLALLRAAWSWREERARRLDRPPFRILREETLVEIARLRSSDRKRLAAIDGAPRAWREGGGGVAELARALDEALALDAADLPEARPVERPRRDTAFEARVRALKARRDERAHALGLEPSVVASRGVLEALQRTLDAGGSPEDVPELRHWQRRILGPLPTPASRL
jgi:ribonuclease D